MKNLFTLPMAGWFLIASGLFFLLAFVPFGGFAMPAIIMGVLGLLLLVGAMALRRNWRRTGYIAFLLALGAAVTGYTSAHDGTMLSNGWFALAGLCSLAGAAILFVNLWKPAARH